ncbi:hypothetical protein OSB04_015931 [Centaurea solstitialis]|uniref:TIR domain-containing protein n=1 Tax=Centaurea solstitialis TaxID=347529 RepID=A0AA38WKK6_9ASTR|nr:hypothetical protein OSB04_015931 [Centaurea solstitialis]
MASSSTSFIQRSFKYDVFLSFRGEDTRKTFIGHLYNALQHKSIHTYKDDERIQKGKQISDELIKSIQDSRFHIIVFSKNYASSSWCLEELVQIIECQRTAEQTAYPVFYDVEPSEVRKQSGEFGQVFAKHEKEEAVGKWRKALEEAAGLAGWELKNTVDGNEARFIQKIVEEISLALRVNNFGVDEKLVGMEARIRDVVSSLDIGHSDVRMIGIKGMGGGGKTTLAKAVFDHISFRFEGSSFVENVRESSNPNFSGLKKLQKQVLRDVLNDSGFKISNVHDGKKKMKRMMCCRKVLVVLDDVDHIDQLKALAGEFSWFNEGSRIIITTRDEQVLVAHGVKLIRDVNLLSHVEAICLFSRYAFGRDAPIQDYKELSKQVVGYGAGLPLTITVLGSFLRGKNELEWKDAIQRLKTIPLKNTLDKLEISYIGLEEEQKEIFLDVACILKGWVKEDAVRALESCGFYARIGLRVLEQKSLINISKYGELGMHDHIEEMGKNIVRRFHPNRPNRHSRLWIMNEIEDIFVSDQGTNEAVRCIEVDTSYINPEIVMKGLGNMRQLKFLHVFDGRWYWKFDEDEDFFYNNWKFDEFHQYFPNALRWLSWEGYPFRSLPKSFQANNLVALEMGDSNIEQLWEYQDRKVLNKLRFLDLKNSKLKNLDLGLTPNLERLSLIGCSGLVELRMPVECPKLIYLDLSASTLTTLDLRGNPNLENLSLYECVDLVELHLPVECLKLVSININDSKLRALDLRGTPNIEKLDLKECVNLVELHIPVEYLNLVSVNINGSKLRTLDLRGTPNIEELDLEGCVDLVELHIPAECLKLVSININGSKLRTLDLRGTLNIEELDLYKCVDLVELHIPIECLEFVSININGSKLRTLDLRGTLNIEELDLYKCVDLVELHIPIECLEFVSININGSKLRTLDLRGTPNIKKLDLYKCVDLVELRIHGECLKLKSINIVGAKLRTFDLGRTPKLNSFSLTECYDLVEVHAHDGCLKELDDLDLSYCVRFKSFSFTKPFDLVEVPSVSKLHLIAESLDMCPLHFGNNLPKFRFECFYKEHGQPSLVGNLEKLISFGLCACTNLERFSKSICGLRCLTTLTLEGSIPDSPKDLDQLECLKELHLLSTKITHLPDSICFLKHLKLLELNRCWLLEKLPEDLGRLECLEKLILLECVLLRDIPKNICKMKRLRYFHLKHCLAIEKLPDEFGRLTCLEELNIDGAGITQLPQSIFLLKVVWFYIRDTSLRTRIILLHIAPKVERSHFTKNYLNSVGMSSLAKGHLGEYVIFWGQPLCLGHETPQDCPNSRISSWFQACDPSFTSSMASSSTSSINKSSFKYDVFLSFRGEDTRTNFVDHLYHAFKLENIETYKDDENLERGKKISKELIQAIENSRFHVIVFSKNYASSSWCLDELVKIMECQEMTSGHIVYPIFYDVEPMQVRKQSGEFGKAFSKHENGEVAKKWRKALVEATSFSGQDLTVDKYEVEFIKKVVKEISMKLPSISTDKNLVGMTARINGVLSSLYTFPKEFCMIGITGMGGIGKTTLARAVFDQISFQFDGKSFVANVREVSKPNFSGLNKLQQQVLRDVSNDQGITVNNVFDGKSMMKKKMPGRKVLLVLDDVDHIEQLKALAGEPSWFMPGSKVIITTRDKQVLRAHKVNSIHDVNLLTDEEAICLLSRSAFGTEIPSPGYKELTKKVVSYAAGLPLTITILGSTLYGETEHVWKDTLKELEKIPLDGTLQRLELSYKGLDTNCQEIFLDVACILKGWEKHKAIRALESCGFHAIRGLNVLEKKSLVTTRYGRLEMHDHLLEMGRYIVRRLHPDEPNKHSRLWVEEEIKDILASDQGTNEAIRCIELITLISPNIVMKGLGNMKQLRFLQVCANNFFNYLFNNSGEDKNWFDNNWKFDEVCLAFPNALRWLSWEWYPFRSLPKSFQANNLVALQMRYSEIVELWEDEDRKVLHKLRFLDLGNSKLKNLDLGLTPNLERLSLIGCRDLVELCILVECPKLVYLDLTASMLTTLDLRGTPNIDKLYLEECVELVELHIPVECLKLKYIKIARSKLRTLDLRGTPNIENLHLQECVDLVELHIPVECLKLESVDIESSKLRTFDLGLTPNLKKLSLTKCYYLVEVHAPVECLKKLSYLNLSGCLRFKSFLCKKRFKAIGFGCLSKLHLIAESLDMCPLHSDNNLPKFQFTCSYEEEEHMVPTLIGDLAKLLSTGLCACTDLERFSRSICGLQCLTKLTLEGDIPEAPNDLGMLECLVELSVSTTKITHLPESICMLQRLKILKLQSCWCLEKLPEDLGRLESLEDLTLSECIVLRDIPSSVCKMKRLEDFHLLYCFLVEKLPEDI